MTAAAVHARALAPTGLAARDWGVPSERLSPAAWTVSGLAIVGNVLVSLPRVARDLPSAAITWLTVVSFVVVGLALLRTDLPRANGWGSIVVGLSVMPGGLSDPAYAESGLALLGFVLEPLYLPAAAALVLRYPRAALGTTERRLIIALSIASVIPRIGMVATLGALPDGAYRPIGYEGIAAPALHDILFLRIGRGIVVALLVAIAVILVKRLLASRGLARQSIAPLIVIGVVCTLAAAVDQAIWVIGSDSLRGVPAALVRDLSAALIPVALLADLLRRRTAGAAVTSRVLVSATRGGVPAIERELREVFCDDSLVLRAQAPVTPVPSDRARSVVRDSAGEVLVVIDYSTRAIQDESLLHTAADALRLSLENVQLQSDLRRSIDDLRDSRARIVQAGAAERRRVEQDLHDGAQQHFLAVAATLARADLVDDDQVRAVVAQARAGLTGALAELRRLARGIHPAGLTQGGLTVALPTLTALVPMPVDLTVDSALRDDRPDPAVETAAYFVVAEGLANVTRYAEATRVVVSAGPLDGHLVVTVADDGIGGAQVRTGGGLQGLRDRVEALGGSLWLHTDPCLEHPAGHGSSVVASIPLTTRESRP